MKEKPAKKRSPRKVGEIKKNDTYYALRAKLVEWRKMTCAVWDPEMPTDGHSLQVFMSWEVLDRVLALAVTGNLEGVESLRSDVDWYYIDTYAQSLLDVIHAAMPRPPPPPSPPPISANLTESHEASTGPSRKKRKYVCSKCHHPGHTGTSIKKQALRISVWM